MVYFIGDATEPFGRLAVFTTLPGTFPNKLAHCNRNSHYEVSSAPNSTSVTAWPRCANRANAWLRRNTA